MIYDDMIYVVFVVVEKNWNHLYVRLMMLMLEYFYYNLPLLLLLLFHYGHFVLVGNLMNAIYLLKKK